MPFEITKSAQRFIRMTLMADGKPGAGFRLAVSPGGCSGLNAEIDVLAAPMPGDAVFEKDGLTLFLPAESRLLLEDVTIDFADSVAQTGLVIHDPKATGTCSSNAASLN